MASESKSNKVMELFENMPKHGFFQKMAYCFAFIGPASLICSTSMGPGTATSCIQAGANFSYSLLWIILLSGLFCGMVAYCGAKITAISGMPVYEFIESKIGRALATLLFAVVLVTWNCVIYSQGSTMMSLSKIIFGDTFGIAAFVITIGIIAYIYVFSSSRNVIKIASLMCTLMAIIFFINIFVSKPSGAELAKGLIPTIPAGSAVVIAGIIGGSCPGTSAMWYSYSVKNENWDTPKAMEFIKYDQIIFSFMFTLFSIGIFVSGAAVLNPAGIQVSSALQAASALEPVAGSFATFIFIAGFWGAVFTTIGGMSTLSSYAMNSMFRVDEDRNSSKVRKLILISIVISLLGGLSGGSALKILVKFMGSLNVGGLFIIAIIGYFLIRSDFTKELKNKWYTNLILLAIFGFNCYSAWTFLRGLFK